MTTYFMKLPVDPKRKPTANGRVTSYGELSVAPWFGLPICDPQSLGGVPGSARVCRWNFGGTIPGQTVRDFGKDAQYGAPDLSFYGGTLISKVQPNPQFSGKCR